MGPTGFRQVDFIERRLEISNGNNGEIYLRNPHPLPIVPQNIFQPFFKHVEEHPDRIWLAERQGETSWNTLSYGEAGFKVAAVTQWFLEHQKKPNEVVMILSGNSIHHAILAFGAMLSGNTIAPLSPAYSLMSSDHQRLRTCFSFINPRFVFAEDIDLFQNALDSLATDHSTFIHQKGHKKYANSINLSEMMTTEPSGEAFEQIEKLKPDQISKLLFTSGSTGTPKAVPVTQEMMCFNTTQTLGLINHQIPPLILDWLPWSHAFAGNGGFNSCFFRGGTYYIDDGKPLPGLFKKTLRNLREISPTEYLNVPLGYEMLIEHLEQDQDLSESFFKRVQRLVFGGAALNSSVAQRLQKIAHKTIGKKIAITSGYGATETTALATAVYWPTEDYNQIGLPIPQVQLKLVPFEDRFEIRIKGNQVTNGYYRNPELTGKAFDDEGYYFLGDTVSWVNPHRPYDGLKFVGRLQEDFKLAQGSWVNSGFLRQAAHSALAPYVRELLVTGINRSFPALIIWPNEQTLESLSQSPDPIRDKKVHDYFRQKLQQHNQKYPATSTRFNRFVFCQKPLSMDAGELTAKGSMNQRKTMEHRHTLIDRLYSESPDESIIEV